MSSGKTSKTSPGLKGWIQSLLDPGVLLVWSAWVYLTTVLQTIFQKREPLALFTNPSKIRDEAFGRFWIQMSSASNKALADHPDPASLLVGSSALIPDLLAQMSGTVLDIGPGSGTLLPLMKPLVKGPKGRGSGQVKKIYGAEPCTSLHEQLQAYIDQQGLTDEYTIVGAPVDKELLLPALRDLEVFGASGTSGKEEAKGTASRRRTRASMAAALAAAEAEGDAIFDTIVCIRVLCSVPNPEKTIADLYNMLKPGGKMIVLEHVRNPGGFGRQKGSLVARAMQLLYHALGWPFFVGDCRMDRDTEQYLLKAPALARKLRRDSQLDSHEVEGEEEETWEEVDLTNDFVWAPLPYLSGVLVKRN